MRAKRAVLFDRHPLLLEALEGILGRLDVVVVAKATSLDVALEAIRSSRPDLVIAEVDSTPSELSAPDFVARCHRICESTKVVLLGADDRNVEQALAAGAAAFILRRAHPDDVSSAVRQALEGCVFYTPVAISRRSAAAASWPYESSPLTRRELEILKLAAEGKSNGELAKLLWVTEQTVKFHLSNVYRKLGVANRTEAALWAHNSGLLDDPVPSTV